MVDAYRVAGEEAVERVLAEHSFTVTVRHDLDEVEKEWRTIASRTAVRSWTYVSTSPSHRRNP
ncbi:TPA: hypothetical protein HA336_03375 [Methanopyrus kandleri]|uniref:Uncharacterized protein n=1 Tax=Methanopyrus kandleri TaxID=2320 RepID=A0A832STZ3_9EURY|nr:hypothetical protein [Methanopyrus kandleri]